MPTHQKFDVHQEITNRIIDALESAGECRLPWIRNKGGTMLRPANVASRKPYNGVNIVSLWVSALASNYPSNLWGTYRQWQEQGCQVRKGEKSSLVVFYKTIDIAQRNEQTGETEPGERMFARASWVFNAAQVEGFEPERDDIPDKIAFNPIARAEGFARATGAAIIEGGDVAAFHPASDIIACPTAAVSSEQTPCRPASFTRRCHELVHWSGAKPRGPRPKGLLAVNLCH